MGQREVVAEGLARIVDAAGLEELFAGSDGDAAFLYALLAEVARGRGSRRYGDVCRLARRRRITPAYVADRAAVLLAALEQRRREDLYRILGVPALAPADVLEARWLALVAARRPDEGGDRARFRALKSAWDVLRDPARRAAYERYWARALAPFERLPFAQTGRHAAGGTGPAGGVPPPR